MQDSYLGDDLADESEASEETDDSNLAQTLTETDVDTESKKVDS
jgi:hypothetical protein